jgi:hypothetical protein
MAPSTIYEFDPRKLPREYLEAIGLVVASSAQTENVVEMGIGGCLGIDVEYATAVTTHMSAPQRDNVLRAAAEIKIDNLDVLDAFDEHLDQIKKAFETRNRYVHRVWGQDPGTGAVFTLRTEARGSVDTEVIPMDLNQVRADAALIYKAGMDLMTFLTDQDLLPPFPPHARPRAHKTKAARKKRRQGNVKAAGQAP